jgi:serine/threonine protein phosphatase PrpC
VQRSLSPSPGKWQQLLEHWNRTDPIAHLLMTPILRTAAGNPSNLDRGFVANVGVGAVVAIADGASGIGGGVEAATMAVEFVRRRAEGLDSAAACSSLLREIDQRLFEDELAGETAFAVVSVQEDRVFGSSVGDSGVWIVGAHTVTDLTGGQARKPFIGSGKARPVEFTHAVRPGDAKLLLATDGLLNHTSAANIIEVCRGQDDRVCAERLISLVRLPSGKLPDDVTVILATL